MGRNGGPRPVGAPQDERNETARSAPASLSRRIATELCMAVLSLDRLSKRFGARLAVDAVSFEVQEREVFGLLGPNGSGKSTILRLVTGYLRPSAGTARVAGLDVVRNGHAARRRIGYVPESAPLYGHMRVAEFLNFMGRLRGIDREVIARAVDAAVERLALGSVRGVIIERLSHGYRQRVSLAQAVLHEPELLVLDEPSNGLDPRQIIELRVLLRQLAQNCAVLVTSHILSEIERTADRAAILLDGRLLTVEQIDRETAAPPASRLETLFLKLTQTKAM
jgi:ABC-2 type transport system ATP-binding protein